jgi:hypothetical protein
MNEHDGEYDPLAKQLRQFTPTSGALDRDALIFSAGRASAKKHVGWKALAGALAASQLLTVVLLWPRAAANVPSAGIQDVATNQSDAEKPESMADETMLSFQLARMRQGFLAAGGEPAMPRISGPIVPDRPPLRAGSSFLPSSLN